MKDFYLQSMVCPVCSVEVSEGKAVRLLRHFGSAFQIRPKIFMTAAHVVNSAENSQSKVFGLVTKGVDGTDSASTFCRIEHWESAPNSIDVAIGCSSYLFDPDWKLYGKAVSPWQDVYSFGYPETATLNHDSSLWLNLRYYKGYVQRLSAGETIDGEAHSFEASFPVDPGMSGSPVAVTVDNRHCLVGVAVGTSTTERYEHNSTEIDEDGKQFKERSIRVEHHSRIEDLHKLADWKPKILNGQSLNDVMQSL